MDWLQGVNISPCESERLGVTNMSSFYSLCSQPKTHMRSQPLPCKWMSANVSHQGGSSPLPLSAFLFLPCTAAFLAQLLPLARFQCLCFPLTLVKLFSAFQETSGCGMYLRHPLRLPHQTQYLLSRPYDVAWEKKWETRICIKKINGND